MTGPINAKRFKQTAITAFLSSFLVACGGSSSGDDTPPIDDTTSYLVSTEFNTGGALSPTEQTVEEGATADFSVTIDDGYQLDNISGCGGSLSDSTYSTGAISADCTVTAEFVEIPNVAPVIENITNPDEVMETETAAMSVTATDEDGTIASYEWVQTSGDVDVTLEGANSAECSFVAPDVAGDTPVTFSVTVTDDDGDTVVEEVELTITNTPANAEISSDVTEVFETESFTAEALTNTGWTYSWTQVEGTTGDFSSTTDALTEFTTAAINADENVTIELTVTDDKGRTDSAQHQVLVKDSSFNIAWQSHSVIATGQALTLELSRAATDADVVVFNGNEVAPDSTNGNQLTVTVPAEASSGAIFVRGELVDSNSVWLEIGDSGLVNIRPDETYETVTGTAVASNLVIVQLTAGNDADIAATVADSIGGAVVGFDAALGVYQIQLETADLAALEAAVATLNARDDVALAMMDPIVEDEAVDWSGDPALAEQRDRNNVEAGAAAYQTGVGTDVIPMFMALGVSEAGLDYAQADFDGFSGDLSGHPKMTLYSSAVAVDEAGGSHGTNVTGLIAGELGDGGNAGLLTAVADNHGGAAVIVNAGSSSLLGRLAATRSMADAGATVINWSWGLHRLDAEDTNEDGEISDDEIVAGALTCADTFTRNNTVTDSQFTAIKSLLTDFMSDFREDYPQTVIVTSAGNGATDAGDTDNRLPSSIVSDQLLVVGAHTSGGEYADGTSEDEKAASGYATSCFDTSITADVKRAHYSNYGERVDISASGTIAGWDGSNVVAHRGTSYAVPTVAATVALMQSIDPNLTPREIKALLRQSALPIENYITGDAGDAVFTRPLTTEENTAAAGQGARLNVEGAINATLTTFTEGGGGSGSVGEPISIGVGSDPVTETITFMVPEGDVYGAVDIYFTVDISGSYSDDLYTFRSQAGALIDEFLSAGRDVQIGLTSYSDFPQSPFGSSYDMPYNMDLLLTDQADQLIGALDELSILSGSDTPESQYEALYQTASRESGWREGALPIIFLATDAPFHNADDEADYPGPGRTATIERLQDNGIRVYGLQSGGTIPEVVELAEVTGAEAFQLSRNSSEIVEAVIAAIDSTTEDLSITLQPFGDFAGLVQQVVPTGVSDAVDGQPIENVQPGETVSFDVTFDRSSIAEGETVSFSFRLRIVIDGTAVIHEIPVTVTIEG